MIKELFFIRSIACLSVVFIHSISVAFSDFGIRQDPDYPTVNAALFVIQMLLMFGTPMFVFISEFILSYNYKEKDRIPKGFFAKRVKYILIPYAVMAVFYSVISFVQEGGGSTGELLSQVLQAVFLGQYHGYFILIIFQFYILHFVFIKFFEGRFKPGYVIGVSLLINFLYLGVFNFMVPSDLTWYGLYILPFFGWVGYFAVAYYCGRNFGKFKFIMNKYHKVILVLPFITGFAVLLMSYTGLLTPIMSKRVDIIFYTISVAFFLFYVASKLNRIPTFILIISQYSFGIYLLHPFIQDVTSFFTPDEFSVLNLLVNLSVYMIVGVAVPWVITGLLNKTKYGPFIVGKVGRGIDDGKGDRRLVTQH